MKSKLAEELRRERAEEALELSPDERVERALALGRQAVEDYMRNFGVSREEATCALRRAGQAGRRYSACNDGDSDEQHRRDR